jgi:sugar phosphate permease
MMVSVAVVSMAADPVTTLTPVFSTTVFAQPDSYTGILVSGFGLGAIIGVSFVAHRVTASIRIVGLALGLLGVGVACFGLSSTAEVGLVSLVLAGVGYLTAVTLATTMIHALIVEEHRGRVMAIWSMSFFGIRPLASLIDGSLESLAGPRTAALCMAAPALLLSGWILRRAAVLRS